MDLAGAVGSGFFRKVKNDLAFFLLKVGVSGLALFLYCESGFEGEWEGSYGVVFSFPYIYILEGSKYCDRRKKFNLN